MKMLLLIQGLFYLTTGIWPLVSVRTFQIITGPKHDIWLVKTVGLLVTSSGLVFIYTALAERNVPDETILLAISNSLALSIIDIHYVIKGIIARIYLLDAVIEISIATFYIFILS